MFQEFLPVCTLPLLGGFLLALLIIDLYIGKIQFDYLISVCGEAERNCPYFPGMGQRIHWEIEDPAIFEGSHDQKIKIFRQTRDLIKTHIEDWLAEIS